jgi:hypothetical protein
LSHSPDIFALVVFQIGSLIYTRFSLSCDPPIYVFQITGWQAHTTTPSFLLVEIGAFELFTWAGFEPRPYRSLPPK